MIGFLARGWPEKGLDQLVRALPIVAELESLAAEADEGNQSYRAGPRRQARPADRQPASMSAQMLSAHESA